MPTVITSSTRRMCDSRARNHLVTHALHTRLQHYSPHRRSHRCPCYSVQEDPDDKWLEGVSVDEALAEKTRKLAEVANAPVKARMCLCLAQKRQHSAVLPCVNTAPDRTHGLLL